MKYIISGTNRPGSRTLQVSRAVQTIYQELGEEVGLIDLQHVDLPDLNGEYGESAPASMKAAIENINSSDGLIVVCPEYNGSYPGALKYFIDHWAYPRSYEYRPVAFIGLGATFGGLRPIEHLQGVFGYRNSFMYPERVFLFHISRIMKDGVITDPATMELLKSQAKGFSKFCSALSVAGIDANSRFRSRNT